MSHRLLLAGLVAATGSVGHAAAQARSDAPRHKSPVHAVRQTRPDPPPPSENLVVHGEKRFAPAPMPNQEIHDPADAPLRDPATNAPLGRFGGSYIDANPVPPINPGLQGPQSPLDEGLQR